MLKKRITYEDFNGVAVTEEFYFNLSKAELVELELSRAGGMQEHLQKIVESEDGKAIIAEFKELILMSYGQRSEDGKRFVKTPLLREEFASTEAYSQLFFELCTDAEQASQFINGIIPAGLADEVANLTASQNGPDPEPTMVSIEDLKTMDPMEVEKVQKGLMTGRYKLSA